MDYLQVPQTFSNPLICHQPCQLPQNRCLFTDMTYIDHKHTATPNKHNFCRLQTNCHSGSIPLIHIFEHKRSFLKTGTMFNNFLLLFTLYSNVFKAQNELLEWKLQEFCNKLLIIRNVSDYLIWSQWQYNYHFKGEQLWSGCPKQNVLPSKCQGLRKNLIKSWKVDIYMDLLDVTLFYENMHYCCHSNHITTPNYNRIYRRKTLLIFIENLAMRIFPYFAHW